MLDVDVPSLLRPHKPSTRARQDGLDAGNGAGSDRLLTCALAGLSNLLVFAFVSLLGPFYPPYALAHLEGASNFTVGLVFALYPLAQIVTTPFGSTLCQHQGRLNTCVLGLELVAVGGLVFGLAQHSIGWHMVARLVQGAGGGCVNVAAFALVMEVSEGGGTLTRDMGIQEVLTGVGFIVGPATAGLLFPTLGLKGMMCLLSLLPLLMGLALLALLAPRGVGRRRRVFAPFPTADSAASHDHEGPFDAGTLAGLSSGRRFFVSSSSSSGARPWWADATVVLVALSLVGDAAGLGFLDPTLAKHLQALLGLGVRQMGLVFAVTPLVYSTTALLVQPLSDRWGHKHTVAVGLLLVGLAFLALGPVPLPFSLPSPSATAEAAEVPLPLLWALVLACQACIGFGSALVIVPACPLLLDRLETQRPGEDFKDRVSALYTLTWSIGDALGPFLGGVLTQLLPATPELRCFPAAAAGGTGKKAPSTPLPPPSCSSPFRWSSAAFGCAVLGIWAAFLLLVPPDVFEGRGGLEEGEAEAATEETGERQRLLRGGSGGSGGPPPASLTQHHSYYTEEGGRIGGVGAYHAISHKR